MMASLADLQYRPTSSRTSRCIVDEAKTFHPDRSIILSTEGELIGVWDGVRMAQAFSNLISNAIEHGTPESVVSISLRGTPDEVVCEVRNEAEPIPPAKLRTLFDPVKRFAIRPASERVASGTQNLGLGVVRGQTDRLGPLGRDFGDLKLGAPGSISFANDFRIGWRAMPASPCA